MFLCYSISSLYLLLVNTSSVRPSSTWQHPWQQLQWILFVLTNFIWGLQGFLNKANIKEETRQTIQILQWVFGIHPIQRIKKVCQQNNTLNNKNLATQLYICMMYTTHPYFHSLKQFHFIHHLPVIKPYTKFNCLKKLMILKVFTINFKPS